MSPRVTPAGSGGPAQTGHLDFRYRGNDRRDRFCLYAECPPPRLHKRILGFAISSEGSYLLRPLPPEPAGEVLEQGEAVLGGVGGERGALGVGHEAEDESGFVRDTGYGVRRAVRILGIA